MILFLLPKIFVDKNLLSIFYKSLAFHCQDFFKNHEAAQKPKKDRLFFALVAFILINFYNGFSLPGGKSDKTVTREETHERK
jgi:hypothetical protein